MIVKDWQDLFPCRDPLHAVDTLVRLGHLRHGAFHEHPWTITELMGAIKSIQSFSDCKPDGKYGRITEARQAERFCGCSDLEVYELGEGLNRWTYLTPTFWHDMGQDAERLVEAWREKFNTFSRLQWGRERVNSRANVFAHRMRIDGRGGTLGWSGLPSRRGSGRTTRFEQRYDSRDRLSPNLLDHEMGHASGLPHSRIASSIMKPFLDSSLDGYGPSDITEVIRRHGEKDGEPPPSPRPELEHEGQIQLTISGRSVGRVVFQPED